MTLTNKEQFELCRQIEILSAPNYNLQLILKDVINNFKIEKTIVSDFSFILNSQSTKSILKKETEKEGKPVENENGTENLNEDLSWYQEINEKGRKSMKDYRLSVLKEERRSKNFKKIGKVVKSEIFKLNDWIERLNSEIKENNMKSMSVISEKIEYIQESEGLEVEISELYRQKNELSSITLMNKVEKKEKNEKDDENQKLIEMKRYFNSLKDEFERKKLQFKDRKKKEDDLIRENRLLKERIQKEMESLNLEMESSKNKKEEKKKVIQKGISVGGFIKKFLGNGNK